MSTGGRPVFKPKRYLAVRVLGKDQDTSARIEYWCNPALVFRNRDFHFFNPHFLHAFAVPRHLEA